MVFVCRRGCLRKWVSNWARPGTDAESTAASDARHASTGRSSDGRRCSLAEGRDDGDNAAAAAAAAGSAMMNCRHRRNGGHGAAAHRLSELRTKAPTTTKAPQQRRYSSSPTIITFLILSLSSIHPTLPGRNIHNSIGEAVLGDYRAQFNHLGGVAKTWRHAVRQPSCYRIRTKCHAINATRQIADRKLSSDKNSQNGRKVNGQCRKRTDLRIRRVRINITEHRTYNQLDLFEAHSRNFYRFMYPASAFFRHFPQLCPS